MNKTYTIGEIFRLGLLKNHKGEPYRQKSSVVNVLSKMGLARMQTPWGPGYAVTWREIESWNTHWD